MPHVKAICQLYLHFFLAIFHLPINLIYFLDAIHSFKVQYCLTLVTSPILSEQNAHL